MTIRPFPIRDLRRTDLPHIGWTGPGTEADGLERALARVALAEAEHLVALTADGEPIGLCGVDYRRGPESATLWLLTVHPERRSRGVGAALVAAAEVRIAASGRTIVELAVEETNRRARALYERLGYQPYRREPDDRNSVGSDGIIVRLHSTHVLLRKEISTG